MISRLRKHLYSRSLAVLSSLEAHLEHMMILWLMIAALAAAARVAAGPVLGALGASTILAYALVVLAPFASMVLALRWFAGGERMTQPEMRFARAGQWRPITHDEATQHPLFGPGGVMVSLLIGMLINVPVRTAEYLATMPAVGVGAPHWLSVLHMMMTLDVVLLSSLYAIAFVAGLRCVPLFPRLLVVIWIIDLLMQLIVAQFAVGAGVPPSVAAPLGGLLQGNVYKVLISVALWLPYLFLSARVNVTYRKRVRA